MPRLLVAIAGLVLLVSVARIATRSGISGMGFIVAWAWAALFVVAFGAFFVRGVRRWWGQRLRIPPVPADPEAISAAGRDTVAELARLGLGADGPPLRWAQRPARFAQPVRSADRAIVGAVVETLLPDPRVSIYLWSGLATGKALLTTNDEVASNTPDVPSLLIQLIDNGSCAGTYDAHLRALTLLKGTGLSAVRGQESWIEVDRRILSATLDVLWVRGTLQVIWRTLSLQSPHRQLLERRPQAH